MKKIKVPTLAEDKAKCQHCELVLRTNSRHGTSHLKHHLDRCPKKVHHYSTQYMLSTETSINGSIVLTKYKYDEAQSRKLVLTYLVQHSHQFDIIEKRGFRKMVKGNLQSCPFSRHTIRRELFKMYVKDRENVKDLISNAPGRVVMTTDNWKNDNTNEDYICVTAQFVDSNWQLRKRYKDLGLWLLLMMLHISLMTLAYSCNNGT